MMTVKALGAAPRVMEHGAAAGLRCALSRLGTGPMMGTGS
jgi:hypothetical protein